MSAMPMAAISLIESSGFILCVWNRRYNGWGLPGGKVEAGEDIRTAQRRELMEETGLTTAHAEPIYAAPTESSDGDRQVFVFRVKPVDYPALDASYEHEPGSVVTWKTRDELLQSSPFRSFYEKLFAAIGD